MQGGKLLLQALEQQPAIINRVEETSKVEEKAHDAVLVHQRLVRNGHFRAPTNIRETRGSLKVKAQAGKVNRQGVVSSVTKQVHRVSRRGRKVVRENPQLWVRKGKVANTQGKPQGTMRLEGDSPVMGKGEAGSDGRRDKEVVNLPITGRRRNPQPTNLPWATSSSLVERSSSMGAISVVRFPRVLRGPPSGVDTSVRPGSFARSGVRWRIVRTCRTLRPRLTAMLSALSFSFIQCAGSFGRPPCRRPLFLYPHHLLVSTLCVPYLPDGGRWLLR